MKPKLVATAMITAMSVITMTVLGISTFSDETVRMVLIGFAVVLFFCGGMGIHLAVKSYREGKD